MRELAKRAMRIYFSSGAGLKKSYENQKRMRVDFAGQYVVKHFGWGSTFLDTSKYEDDRIAKFGVLEPQMQDIFRVFIRPNSMVLDVGANAGLHSLLFSDILAAKANTTRREENRATGEVLAFEPNPQNFFALLRNLALNDRHCVEPFEFAISDFSGTAPLNIMPADSYWQGCHSLVANEKLSKAHAGGVKTLDVRTRRIDDILAERASDLPVSFIKIDVEGGEPAALRGASETIAQHRPVIALEMVPERASHLGMRKADFPAPLTDGSYRSFAIFKDGSMSEVASFEKYLESGVVESKQRAIHSEEMLLVPSERLER